MALAATWFQLDNKLPDIDNVLEFLSELRNNTHQFFKKEYSNFYAACLDPDGKDGVTPTMIRAAHKDAVAALSIELVEIRHAIEQKSKKKELIKKLFSIGFTGESLKLKAANLNRLWSKIISHTDKMGKSILDFSNNKLVKLLRKFLTYLNSMLGSLSKLVPGVDAMKEFKEIIESYLSIADE